jgi:exopolysaccharide production protein ExoZ
LIWSLQVLRFIAALMIVYVHAAQISFAATGSNGLIPHDLQLAGRAGVDIFFVLSGVVIARSAPGLTCAAFAWKRFRRIVPIYLLCCIPALLVAAKTGFGWRELLATFLLWPATDVMTAPLLPVAWTLCFEMLFYGAATLVLADKRWTYVLLGAFAIASMLRSFGPAFQLLGNPLILEFLLGVAIAYAPSWRRAIWGIPIGAAALAGAGFVGIEPTGGTLEFLTGSNAFERVLVYGLPSALIVYGTMQITVKKSVWTYLGDTSYSLYLTHTLLVSALLVFWTAFPIAPDLILVLTVLASVLFGWRIHQAVEKPILRALGRDPQMPSPAAEEPALQPGR